MRNAAELAEQGCFVSPICMRAYRANRTYKIPDIVRDFKKYLLLQYDEITLRNIKAVCCTVAGKTMNTLEDLCSEGEILDNYGVHANATLKQYGYRWRYLQSEV